MNDWATWTTAILERHPGKVDAAIAAVLVVIGLTVGLTEFRSVGQRPGDILPPVPRAPRQSPVGSSPTTRADRPRLPARSSWTC